MGMYILECVHDLSGTSTSPPGNTTNPSLGRGGTNICCDTPTRTRKHLRQKKTPPPWRNTKPSTPSMRRVEKAKVCSTTILPGKPWSSNQCQHPASTLCSPPTPSLHLSATQTTVFPFIGPCRTTTSPLCSPLCRPSHSILTPPMVPAGLP